MVTMPVPGGGHRPALSRCVALAPARFAEVHWGRAPLLTRARELAGPCGFADLFCADAADELLSRRGLRTPFLRIAKQGALTPAGRFTAGGGAGAEIADQVADDKVLTEYAAGATLVLQGLHRLWPPLIDFTRELGLELAQPVQANAYLTPAGNQGFATHYDTHDVFVLQIDGRKRWLVHEPVLPEPLERQPWGGRADDVSASADGRPALDIELAPGDALYLPRGWLHAASAQDQRSIHLTFGVRALTRYALVEELMNLAAADQRLRATLPYGLDVSDPDQIEPELAATVEALRDWLLAADPAALAERLRRRTWPSARPAPIQPLAQAAAAQQLGPEDRIVLRHGLRTRLTADDDRVVLLAGDRTLSFPEYCAAALHAVLGGTPYRIGDLPGLDADADRLVLGRRLLIEAVAVPAT